MTVLNSEPATNEADTPAAPAPKQGWLHTLWIEIKGLFWLLLAVLAFHSFIAKPFYIPSISMMPTLLVGDRLFVSKFAYGWSFVSPTIPNPAALFQWLVLREEVDSLAFTLPASKGRVWGAKPQRGDVVILTPEGKNQDYIKRVIGMPGDLFEMRGGEILLNGKKVKAEAQPVKDLPVDANNPCTEIDFPGALTQEADGSLHCFVQIVRETLPNGVSYDTIDARRGSTDDVAPIRIPAGHYYLLGDNRDNSADSRVDAPIGLGGPVAWERIGGRAEIITFSLDGSTTLNPASWFSSFRSGRAGSSLRPDRSGTSPSK